MTDAELGVELDRLAALAGIEPSYTDYFGNATEVSRETKAALLGALGFAANDGAAVASSLAELEDAPWRTPLVAATIARRGRIPVAALTLPAGDATRRIEWRIVCEDGTERRGAVRLAALDLTAERFLDGRRLERRTLKLPASLPLGYHRLQVEEHASALIVAPPRCYVPGAIERGRKIWGLAVQVYGLRSRRDWGIGDFSDLAAFARDARRAGAAAIGLNPLHELDPANPAACSPYSPSSRLFLNVAYLDVEAIPEFADCEAARRLVAEPSFIASLAALRAEPLVDYAGAWAHKRKVLETLYAWFREAHVARDTPRARAFQAFAGAEGEALERLATFEALRERFAAERPGEYGWSNWPAEYRAATSSAVAQFANDYRARVEFFQYLQWNADAQLAAAARACGSMPIGLYRDLAVGAEAGGAEPWADPRLLPPGISIGAPPDPLNVQGQNWGLAPLNPLLLRGERAFAPFVRLLRANMRHAGALRIDHVMALQRLFWIPHGMPAAAGAYVRYPLDDLLALTALESQRSACLVIGEDLGTVPEGFRERLEDAGAFSTRLLYFERTLEGSFRAPQSYPAYALASPGTHDLPTMASFLTAADVQLRANLAMLPAGASPDDAIAGRRHEIGALLDALVADGDLMPDTAEYLRHAGFASAADVRSAVEASYRFLARSAAGLVVAPLEDALGVVEQTNVPGTTWQQPNWRRRLPVDVEALASDPRFLGFAAVLRALRRPFHRRRARSSSDPR